MKGQKEEGNETGYVHWQVMICMKKKTRPGGIKKIWPTAHNELVMSLEKCEEYVWKDDTAIAGTRFELGKRPFKRNCVRDWDQVRECAVQGKLEEIDSATYITHYKSLKSIMVDNLKPQLIERQVTCYWGCTGTGKSHKAWNEAGLSAYPKISSTKFWDAYRGHENVVIEEFTGEIGISHLLRWFDKWPVIVEQKGTATILEAKRIWITSNVDPREWYPNATEEQKRALMDRMDITHFNEIMPNRRRALKRMRDEEKTQLMPTPSGKGKEKVSETTINPNFWFNSDDEDDTVVQRDDGIWINKE